MNDPDTRAAGCFTPAEYTDQAVEEYRGNPHIEALPPIMETAELVRTLTRRPPHSEADRSLPAEVRSHLTMRTLSFVQPLSIHLDVARRLSRLLRSGYIERNPASPTHAPSMEAGLAAFASGHRIRRGPKATGMFMSGVSGVGKTTAVEVSLAAYPQIIQHSEYRGRPLLRTQLVHLHIQCPADSSLRALCIAFLRAVDDLLETRYEHQYVRFKTTTDMLLGTLARIAAVHGLGLLVVDEIQHLATARSGGERVMLNFISQLVNTVGVPVVLVGTPKAASVLSREFRHARRGTGQGDLFWDRLTRTTDAGDAEWRHFCQALWRYQYLRDPTPLNDPLLDVVYEESQGITDVAVKLVMLAQNRAIQTGTETLTVGLIRSVAHDSLRSIRRVLQALKANETSELAKYEDVLAEGLDRIVADGVRETLRVVEAPPPAADPSAAPSTAAPPTKPPRAPRARRKEIRPGTLMAIAAAGRAAKRCAYDAFRDAGLVESCAGAA